MFRTRVITASTLGIITRTNEELTSILKSPAVIEESAQRKRGALAPSFKSIRLILGVILSASCLPRRCNHAPERCGECLFITICRTL
ncbi:hypothetical protein LMH87_010939 [Akanthomyces muscarius]|uniref:Uncharacterized protein n=1 Tax=Akanthomyces muscarius TaxID=2231603 RepID=A0A9W8Q8R3_AKAMU|nr:hypothetical protein LMH87_010939 [Akanthomyces muscarius]KAJ4150176.1 hypothetical protein LMH87_010939 [Akanthomyces muscarius]